MNKNKFGDRKGIALIGQSTRYPETLIHKILRILNNLVRPHTKHLRGN